MKLYRLISLNKHSLCTYCLRTEVDVTQHVSTAAHLCSNLGMLGIYIYKNRVVVHEHTITINVKHEHTYSEPRRNQRNICNMAD